MLVPLTYPISYSFQEVGLVWILFWCSLQHYQSFQSQRHRKWRMNYVYFYQNQTPNFEVKFNSDFPLQFSLQPFYPPYTWRSGWIVRGNSPPSQRGSSRCPSSAQHLREKGQEKRPQISCSFVCSGNMHRSQFGQILYPWPVFLSVKWG